MSNIVLFAVWNRPEMLQVVMEDFMTAYEYHPIEGLKVLFIVEGGAPPKVIEHVENFPLEKEIIIRPERIGLTQNILKGMKVAMEMTEDYVIFQADDIIVHKTFFQYIDVLLNMGLDKTSVYLGVTYVLNGDVDVVHQNHFYDAAGATITKRFYDKYIKPCATEKFYKNARTRHLYVTALDKKYQSYYPVKYKKKYGPGEHNEQAGLINRLTDIAFIHDGFTTIQPEVTRVRNIGFYGKNRPGSFLPGNSYDERLANLREIIVSSRSINAMTRYKTDDYRDFPPELDAWDGKIIVKGD